ncbi:proteinase inhibitor I4 serpin, partial [Cellulomonas bogoriensis 69B4 = DSM 16987]
PGADGDAPDPTVEPTDPDDAPADGETSLTITVDPTGEGATTTWTLTCDPPGGDHPDPEAACAQLAQVGTEGLAPVPADAMCTQQWGGPQTATVTGTLDGTAVDATFRYTDGCEIHRWDALSAVLGNADGLL